MQFYVIRNFLPLTPFSKKRNILPFLYDCFTGNFSLLLSSRKLIGQWIRISRLTGKGTSPLQQSARVLNIHGVYNGVYTRLNWIDVTLFSNNWQAVGQSRDRKSGKVAILNQSNEQADVRVRTSHFVVYAISWCIESASIDRCLILDLVSLFYYVDFFRVLNTHFSFVSIDN